jgi:hypothetical protein
MANKTLNAWGASYLRGCRLYLLVAALVVPLGCVCIGVPLYVVQNGTYDDTTTLLIMVVPMAGFFLLVMGGSLGFAAWMIRSRQRQLDDAFTPLGLAGSMYLLNGRQYHGTAGGRRVDAYFYRGPTLDIYLGTPLKTRLGIGTKDTVGQAVAGLMNRRSIALDDPSLRHLSVFPLDEAWSRALLADPTARAALLRLTADEGPFELRQVILQPESLRLRLHHTRQSHVTPENVRQWFNDLLTVARAAEGLPPPQQTAEASGLERTTRSNRNALFLPALGIAFALLCGLSLCALVPVAMILLSGGR